MKKLYLCLASVISGVCVAASLLAGTMASDLQEGPASPLSTKPHLKEKLAIKKEPLPSKMASSLLLYEDFESVTGEEPYDLPSQWVSVANPDRGEDKWLGGTLFDESGQLMGSSGEKYAFILPDITHPHDAWMFSPAVSLEKDNGYKLSFYAIMLANRSVMESLEVVLCSKPSPDKENIVSTLLAKKDDCKSWTYMETYINDIPEGTYYIGFHADAEANSGGLLIDDVMLTNVDAPVFLGASAINFGSKYTKNPSAKAIYEIWNNGYTPLEVTLESCSPEITVSGLPATVEASAKVDMTVILDVAKVGTYEGEIVLSTNDPLSQKVVIPVKQIVMEIPLGNSKLHTFEDGTPSSFKKCNAIVNNLIGKGKDGSRSLYFKKDLTATQPGIFYTDFVELGQNPRFRMDYMLQKEKMMGTVIENMEAESPKLNIFITSDYGVTWTEVYRMGKGEENEFDGAMDYHHVDADLSKWKGETCQLRIEWNGDVVAGGLMNRANMRVYMDNFMLGTPYETDLCLSLLSGPAAATSGAANEYSATVANYGNSDASNYIVKVTDESGKVIAEIAGETLKPYEQKSYKFSHSFAKAGTHTLNAECVVLGDADQTDNTAIPLYVSVRGSEVKPLAIPDDAATGFQWTMAVPVNFYAFAACSTDLYYANEIGINRTTISSLEYDVKGDEYRSDLFRVYLAETDLDEFADDSQFPEYENMTKVFEGRIHFLPGETKMIIPFDAPYAYNGKNLIVYTEHFGNEFVYGRFGKIISSDKKRELAGDCDIVLAGRAEFPESKKGAYGRYVAATFNVADPEEGSVHGQVVNANGEPVEDAKVCIANTSFSVTADKDGHFSMPRVAVGEYELTADKTGYFTGKAQFAVAKGGNPEVKIVLSEIAEQKVSGTVKDLNGNPVAGSVISFEGEKPGTAYSDSEGLFTIDLLGQSDYQVSVVSENYTTLRTSIRVDNAPLTLNCTVDEIAAHPYKASASLGDDAKVGITWQAPVVQLHHDTGKFQFELGYDYGYREIIFGSAYHEKAIVKEVSWYMTDLMAHDDFHVYVFGLTDGEPDARKILYHAEKVDWTDNTWNTHVLTEPVEADGFMVAVACSGFMCIGVTEADDNYPYVPNTEYYAGDSYRFRISEMSTSSYKNNHWMLRAGVEKPASDVEASRPEILSYIVYRYDNSTQKWEEIGKTQELTYIDNILALPNGTYRWGVSAEYSKGVSPRANSEMITFVGSGIDDIINDKCSAAYSAYSRTLNFTGEEYIDAVKIYDISGSLALSSAPCQEISVDAFAAGTYTCVTYLKDGSIIVTRFIK